MQQVTRTMMFSASDDSATMKKIQATHAPDDGREVDVKPILHIIENVLRGATPTIDGVLNGSNGHAETMEEITSLASFDGMLEALSYMIHKISCELSCRCSGGGDAHATTTALFNILANYSWEAKMVLALAAFAVNYGEFWLVVQHSTTNSLANSVALLKQLPDILEHHNSLRPQFDAVNNLIKATLDLTNCIIEFQELPSQYISTDLPAMSIAMANIPVAAYWTIRCTVACSSQISSLIGLRSDFINASTAEAWELSSLAHKVSSINDHLKKQLTLCLQHIDEKRQAEASYNLVRLIETIHVDNMKVLKALVYSKDDHQALVEGSTKTTIHIDILRKKHVLLLISDLDLPHEEIAVLDQIYKESKAGSENCYEILWLPVVDKSTACNEEFQHKFEQLQAMMPWFSVQNPSLIEPAVIKYIKEVWHFSKRPILVPLDPQGKVLNQNAFNLLWIWRNQAFPFTSEREEALWNAETSWGLEQIVDQIDETVLKWMAEEKYICVYGGDDIEWIRQFTSSAKAAAKAAQITLEMVYVGKSNATERLKKIIATITEENLSYSLTDSTSIWFFWARLESMLYSKLQHGKSVENDHIVQEVMTILGFDGSDQGWGIFCKGKSNEMARAEGDKALTCMLEFDSWIKEAKKSGFVQGIDSYLQQLHTPHHCNRLILPGSDIGELPGKVKCAECGRLMEKFFMYRCCVD